MSQVSVTAVTSAIDANIAAGNIKDGVTILGITGTYDPQPSLESKTASYTANGTYTITPSTGYDGINDVEVTVNVSGGSGTQCLDWSSIGWDCNDVADSGLAADVAYVAQKKAEYEAGTISSFNGTVAKGLRYIPKGISVPAESNSFFSNPALTYVPMLDFSNVTNMLYMFRGANIGTIPLLDTSKVTVFGNAFENCKCLQSIPNINTGAGTTFYSMFKSCEALTTIPA